MRKNSQNRYDELDDIIQHLYEDKIKGQLSEERFEKLSAGYEAEQKGLEKIIQELSGRITQKTDKTINIYRFMKLVKKNTSFEELPEEAAIKELLAMMEEKNLSIDDLKSLIG